MPSRDITGEVALRAGKTISRLRERMGERVSMGPLREQLTSKEARLRLQRLDPATKIKMIEQLGEEEWNNLVEQITSGTQLT